MDYDLCSDQMGIFLDEEKNPEYEVIPDYKPVTDIEKDIDNTYLEDLKSWGEPPSWTNPMKEELLPITFDYLRFKSNIETLIWDPEVILKLELSKYYKLNHDYFSKSVANSIPSHATPNNDPAVASTLAPSLATTIGTITTNDKEATNIEDINEIKDFLLKGRYIKLKEEDKVCKGFRPIEAGILCGGKYKRVYSSSTVYMPFLPETDIGNRGIENRKDLNDGKEQPDLVNNQKIENDNNKKIEEIKNERNRHYIEFIIIISAPNRRGDPGRLYILNF